MNDAGAGSVHGGPYSAVSAVVTEQWRDREERKAWQARIDELEAQVRTLTAARDDMAHSVGSLRDALCREQQLRTKLAEMMRAHGAALLAAWEMESFL